MRQTILSSFHLLNAWGDFGFIVVLISPIVLVVGLIVLIVGAIRQNEETKRIGLWMILTAILSCIGGFTLCSLNFSLGSLQ